MVRKSGYMSFLILRKYIGILGITLPFQILLKVGLIASISLAYYTPFHDLFVGNLCVIGLFLFADKGYDSVDSFANRLAGLCAILVGLNPCQSTKIVGFAPQYIIHYVAAITLFLALAYISYFRFTKTNGNVTPEKFIRNDIYTSCAGLIMGSIIAIALGQIFNYPIFFPESIALVSFGLAWFVKGKTLFQDK